MRAASWISSVHFAMHLLERVASARAALDLADEEDHRRRVLLSDMEAERGIGGAGASRHETHARPARRLADGLRHHRRAALMAADGDGDVAIVERVEHGEIAFAGHAEDVAHAMGNELVDEDFRADAGPFGARQHAQKPSAARAEAGHALVSRPCVQNIATASRSMPKATQPVCDTAPSASARSQVSPKWSR